MNTSQFYLGVEMVLARPEEKHGKPGYAVHYKDGYKFWSPKAAFERAYFPVGPGGGAVPNVVTPAMIEAYMQKGNPTGLALVAVDVGLDFALAWANQGLTRPGAEIPPIPFGVDVAPPETEAPPTGPAEVEPDEPEPEPEPDDDEDLDEEIDDDDPDVDAVPKA